MYLKKTWRYRDHIEIRKYHTSRYGVKGEKRSPKEKPTELSVQLANERAAEKRLLRLLINNFDTGDHHMTLTYRPKERPDPEGARKILGQFLRKMRKAYVKMGMELKYIAVTEWTGKAIHHHVVINDCPGFSRLTAQLWPHGGARSTALYPNHDYKQLAEYLIKETSKTFRSEGSPWGQRYTCSRNLKKPEETTEVIKAKEWRTVPSVPKSLAAQGYVLQKESVFEGTDIFGYPYLEYTMVKKGKSKGG